MKRLYLFLIMGIGLLMGACSSADKDKTKIKTKLHVRTHKVEAQKDVHSRKFIGIVEEELASSISFPITGNLEKLHVTEGQFVRKGDLLAELNPYSLKNAHAATHATLLQAEDAMKRLQLLYDNKSLPEIQYIEMQTNLETAKAAEAIARKNLKDSRLYAPFTGVIGKIASEIGENVLPTEPVLILLKINNVDIKISIPEKEINQIKEGQLASIHISAANGITTKGKVDKKGVLADPISHSYPVRISVQNPESKLLPGMVSEVIFLDEDNQKNIIIPNQCVLKDGKGNHFVWKVINSRVQKQIVKLGTQKTTGVEVCEGLSLNDEIVIEGYQKVANGLNVNVL